MQEKKRVIKIGTGGVSVGGHTYKAHEVASLFSAMFKCTVADTPKNLLKRASFLENSDEQVMSSLFLLEPVVFYSKHPGADCP